MHSLINNCRGNSLSLITIVAEPGGRMGLGPHFYF